MRYALLLLVGLLVLPYTTGCASVGHSSPLDVTYGTTQRYAMVIQVKPEKLEYYKQLHAEPWPGVLRQLEKSNIHNFSINLVEIRKGEYTLFGYFEYTGEDFDADMAAMAADPETQRWWAETGPCQIAIPTAQDTLEENSEWFIMEEVFYHP